MNLLINDGRDKVSVLGNVLGGRPGLFSGRNRRFRFPFCAATPMAWQNAPSVEALQQALRLRI
jgi:hypothetical protein